MGKGLKGGKINKGEKPFEPEIQHNLVFLKQVSIFFHKPNSFPEHFYTEKVDMTTLGLVFLISNLFIINKTA